VAPRREPRAKRPSRVSWTQPGHPATSRRSSTFPPCWWEPRARSPATASTSSQFLSGTPISKRGGQPIYSCCPRFVIPRGSFGRTPDIYNLDLHLAFPIQLGGGTEITLIADIFNVTDQQEPNEVDQIWTFEQLTVTEDPDECGGPGTGPETTCQKGNPNFGTPLAFQRPRTLRFGAKISR
jgi:hypothetical protein